MSSVSAYSTQSLTLLETLRNLVLDEKEASDAHLREIWRRPLNERIEKGWCLPLNRIQPGPLPHQLRLHFDENLSRFREGDLVCLNPGDPFEQPCWHELIIEKENSSSLLVSHKQAPDILAFCQDHQQLWTLDTDTMDLTAYYLNAIDDLGKTRIGRERVLPLLLGQADNVMDADDYQLPTSTPCNVNVTMIRPMPSPVDMQQHWISVPRVRLARARLAPWRIW